MVTRVCFFIFLSLSFHAESKSLNFITTKTDGKIDRAIDVEISKDDQFVYVAGFPGGGSRNDLVVFRRDSTNDSLTVIQSFPDSFSLFRVQELLLSSNQKNIYALEEYGDELSVLARDSETGMLREIQNIQFFDFPEANISDTKILAESNDGKYLLVSGGDLSISVFERDLDTGELEFFDVYEVEPNISIGYEIRDLKFTPNSEIFYVAGSSGIAAFSFNASEGGITFLWSENGHDNEALSTLQSSWEIAINENNNDVYLASRSGLHVFSRGSDGAELLLRQFIDIDALEQTMVVPRKIEINNDMLYIVFGENGNFGSFEQNGIIQFDIDGSSGLLTQVDAIFNGIDIEYMHGPMDLEFTSSGKHAYVPSYVSGVLLAFTRNETDGKLSYETVTNAENGVRGIKSPKNITVSNDNKFLYVTDRVSGISVFEFLEASETLKFVQTNSLYGYDSGYSDVSLALSPDGKHIYLPRNTNIHLFDRSTGTGKVTHTKTFKSGQNWINDFKTVTSFVMSADGKFIFASHSNSKWLLTVLSRDPTTGDLTLIERIQNNVYGNSEGIAEFHGAIYTQILPDNKHLLVFSNSSDLALFSIDPSTGQLTLKQLMENELFGVSKVSISTEAIGLYGNTLYFPYKTHNDNSSTIDSGIIAAELNSETSTISQTHKYSSNEESHGWLQGAREITLDPSIGRIYLTKNYGDSFIALSINDTTKELSFLEELALKGTVLKEGGEPKLVNTFDNGKYILSVDSVNHSLSLFRKNTPPESSIDEFSFSVRVGEYLLIDFDSFFSDFDNDLLEFEILGTIPDWMNEQGTYVDGTPGSTDLGATFELKVSDGVDKVSKAVSVQVINTKPYFIGATTTYNVNVNDEININFDEVFRDDDNDLLIYEVNGTLPSWLSFAEDSLKGTPNESDVSAQFILNVFDGINNIEVAFAVNVIKPAREVNNNVKSGGALLELILLGIVALMIKLVLASKVNRNF